MGRWSPLANLNHAPRQSFSSCGQANPRRARSRPQPMKTSTDRPRRCYSILANFVSACSGAAPSRTISDVPNSQQHCSDMLVVHRCCPRYRCHRRHYHHHDHSFATPLYDFVPLHLPAHPLAHGPADHTHGSENCAAAAHLLQAGWCRFEMPSMTRSRQLGDPSHGP